VSSTTWHEAGYLTGVTVAQSPYLLRIQPTTEARRASGQWPMPGAEMYDRLLQVLDERIAAEPDERKRARLQRARASIADVGRGVFAGLIVEAMKFGAGMAG
jgi:hypothetical protein